MCQLNTRSWAIALAAMLAPPQLASAADHGPVFGLAKLASPATSCGSHCRQGTGADMIATAADGGS